MALRARGLALCRPHRRGKKPIYAGWSARSLEPDDFRPDDMVGILGGPLSCGGRPGHALVILDLDTREAVERADGHLPRTDMAEGRAGKPRSHRYYLVPLDTVPAWATSAAEQAAAAARVKTGHAGPFIKSFGHRETKAEVIRFLGTGGQVVCPPSVHPSGERREWEGGGPGEPAVVAFPDLWRAVCELASACGAEVPDVAPRPVRLYDPRASSSPIDVTRRASKYLAKMESAIAGQRGHNALFAAARAMVWGFCLEPDEALRLLAAEYNPRCVPPWSEKDLRHKVEDADRIPSEKPRGHLRDSPRPSGTVTRGRADRSEDASRGAATGDDDTPPPPPDEVLPPPPPRGVFDDTDIANGRRFAADHGANVRYVADWGQWAVFDGRRWAVDRSETRVEALAKETADRMAREAAERIGELARAIAAAGEGEEDGLKPAMKRAQAALAHAKKSADMRTVRRMLQAARSEPRLCVAEGGKVFDTRRDLLNCPNGTVELRTGGLRPHRQDDYITKLCPTRFDPAARSDAYLEFLTTTFDGRPAVAEYARRLSGYVCTGEVTDQTLNIFNGDGSNGKNVLTDTWKSVLGEGEYAHTAPAELLVGDGGFDRHPTEKTGLRGARLVVCSETREDGVLDETKMKALTGGDTVTARFMRGDFFQFQPTHKLILLTNNRPRVRGTDHGIWRRIRLVPFAVKFWKEADRALDPGGDYPERFRADPTLGDRLQTAEAEGVLADMVRQAVAVYQAGGTLTPPAEVARATSEYQGDQDVIGQFFAARVREDPAGRVKGADLYKAFCAWWAEEGHPANKAPGSRKFGMAANRKFQPAKSSNVVYAVRLLGGVERVDGTMGAIFHLDAHAGAHTPDSYRGSPPIHPSSRPDPDELAERADIAEFGGG